MSATHTINVDLASVWKTPARVASDYVATLSWGDGIEVDDITPSCVRLKVRKFSEARDGSITYRTLDGYIVPTKSSGVRASDVVVPSDQNRVLKVNFVDVQQGDASVIETPKGRIVLVDGGENKLFARYLANRYPGTSETHPLEVDCIVVTHGDADHFAGLTEILKSEGNPERHKRLFIHPQRVYHNGLVKRPAKTAGVPVANKDMFGATVRQGRETIITGLESDLLKVDPAQMNLPFRQWRTALAAYGARGPIAFRRLQQGDDAFDFLAPEGMVVDVLAPIPTPVNGTTGLRYLGSPSPGPRIGHGSTAPRGPVTTGLSPSHTINGHSVAFRLTYGQWRFLFSGDLNEEAEYDLTTNHAARLRAEVFKVPHHGSADFSTDFLRAVNPVVSVVSSGDETSRKEYIHPRATLMGALGRCSRLDEPLVFVTELVAFFETKGYVDPECHQMQDGHVVMTRGGQPAELKKRPERVFAFTRTAFGLVRVRTDGRRLVVSTDSGKLALKEAYAYEMDANGTPTPACVRQV